MDWAGNGLGAVILHWILHQLLMVVHIPALPQPPPARDEDRLLHSMVGHPPTAGMLGEGPTEVGIQAGGRLVVVLLVAMAPPLIHLAIIRYHCSRKITWGCGSTTWILTMEGR